MYEMYPDGWQVTDDRREPQAPAEQPRRRARKVHSVLPAVLGTAPVATRAKRVD